MKPELDYLEFISKCFINGHHIQMPIEIPSNPSVNIFFANTQVGNLRVKSGQLVAADALEVDSVTPFDMLFPVGEFPVQLSLMKVEGDERIAFSRILFSEEHSVRIDMATKLVKNDESDEFSVDSGTACYLDITVLGDLDQITDDDEDWFEKIEKKMNDNYEHTRSWYLLELGTSNIAFFTAGFGDGTYKSYVTYDANNNITQLITDFNLFVN
ncbi:DUF4241 domain-containing protein [Dyadobacter chenhuakuii]|uniref:DUF4241 domain-containing protein n=1 Tax=Dyadobacter chenhuakuii TaxID=2909339 RepID=A0ABY5EBD4_9BACT|nr:DUF4241 domain-containing protein [Dyadobacter chenhuakuii]UTM21805.1 DUF4241 domain-containing protein [Dyadobacter chenhuakuii]